MAGYTFQVLPGTPHYNTKRLCLSYSHATSQQTTFLRVDVCKAHREGKEAALRCMTLLPSHLSTPRLCMLPLKRISIFTMIY